MAHLFTPRVLRVACLWIYFCKLWEKKKGNPNSSSLVLYKINFFFKQNFPNTVFVVLLVNTGLANSGFAAFAPLCHLQPRGLDVGISFTVEMMHKYIKTHPPTHNSAFSDRGAFVRSSSLHAHQCSAPTLQHSIKTENPRDTKTQRIWWMRGALNPEFVFGRVSQLIHSAPEGLC